MASLSDEILIHLSNASANNNNNNNNSNTTTTTLTVSQQEVVEQVKSLTLSGLNTPMVAGYISQVSIIDITDNNKNKNKGEEEKDMNNDKDDDEDDASYSDDDIIMNRKASKLNQTKAKSNNNKLYKLSLVIANQTVDMIYVPLSSVHCQDIFLLEKKAYRKTMTSLWLVEGAQVKRPFAVISYDNNSSDSKYGTSTEVEWQEGM